MSVRSFITSRKALLSMATALSLSATSLFFFGGNQKSKPQPVKLPDKVQKQTQSNFRTNMRQTLAQKVVKRTSSQIQRQTTPLRSMKSVQCMMGQCDRIMEKYTRKHLAIREGNISHLYLDSKGLVTAGIGLNVNSWNSFKQLDFMDAQGRLLTEQQKRMYYARIQNYKRQLARSGRKFNKLAAGFYADKFAYRPSAQSISRLFERRLKDSIASVKKMLGLQKYYNLHPYAQGEMAMMHYNMGSGKFNPNEWPALFAAARRADYLTMSNQCHIKNDERRSAFLKAGFCALKNIKMQAIGDLYSYHLNRKSIQSRQM
ncbi:MAG: hypothetical protein E7013_02685 [Alphaproteobacteria bacterium]|nr:hypothetical protein [Alphaproteobacteria bacterium]